MKYCKDCKFVSYHPISYDYAVCNRLIIDYVHEKITLNKDARQERLKGECGKEAKFFEQKEKIVEIIKYYKPTKKWWQIFK